MLLAYFSPEVTLPVASVIATVAGFVLACGRPVFSWIGRRIGYAPRKDIELAPTAVEPTRSGVGPTPPRSS